MRFGAVALVVLVACSGGPPNGTTLAQIHARGEITWGADLQGGEPYVYEDPASPSHLIGFEVDIMDAIARRLGVKARMVQYNWSNLVPSLERGDFDVVMNGLEATQERRERILLSDPYFVYAETLAVRTDSAVRSIFELGGKRVGTLNQTFAHDILRMIPSIEPALYEGNEEPYLDLEQHRVDAVLLDNIIADRYGCTAQHPTIKCLRDDVARGTYVLGMRKTDRDLARAIDDALAAMRADGELERILRKAKLWDDRQREDTPVAAGNIRGRVFDVEMVWQFVWAATVTLKLSVLAFLLAVPIGLLLAIARVFGGPIVATAARIYIELFRGTPVLLQLFVLYSGSRRIGASVRSKPPSSASASTTARTKPKSIAARCSRSRAARPRPAGRSACDRSQILRHVLLPQALRLALPPMTNDFVSLLKDSSLVSVITVIELTKRMTIAAVDMRGWLVPGLACAVMYLALSFPLSELARRLERRLSRDQRPQAL